MLGYFTLILFYQLLGEAIVTFAEWPFPGPVLGMVLLFLTLLVRGGLPDGLGSAADGLISNLSVMFIPAGVGVLLYVQLIGQEVLPIASSLIISTLMTVAVTGLIMKWLSPKESPDDGAG